MSFRRRIARLVATLGAVACLWACNAPFIPVPPPQATFEALTSTTWTATGGPYAPAASALYYLRNTTGPATTTINAQAAADGSYTTPVFDGNGGDVIEIFYDPPSGGFSQPICQPLIGGTPPPAPVPCP